MKAVLNIHTGVIVVGIAVCLWVQNWLAATWALTALFWCFAKHDEPTTPNAGERG